MSLGTFLTAVPRSILMPQLSLASRFPDATNRCAGHRAAGEDLACPVLVCRGTEGSSLTGTLAHRDVMTTEPEEVAIFHPDTLSGYILLIPQTKEGDVTSEMAANGPAGSECCCGWL